MTALTDPPITAGVRADPPDAPMTERAANAVADLETERALALLAARLRVDVHQAALKRALDLLKHTVAGQNPVSAVLHNVLLEAEPGESGGALSDGTLRLVTNNLENVTIATLQATVLAPGAFTVPHDLLLSLVAKLAPGPVSLAADGAVLHVEQGRAKTRIKGIAADELPPVPTTEGGTSVTLSAAAWRQIIDLVGLVAGKDEARSWLAGVHLVGRPGEPLLAEAADGVRLARLAPVPGTELPAGDEVLDVLVPKTTLALLRRVLPSKGGDDTLLTLHVGKERNAISITAPLPEDNAYRSLRFVGRVYEATYPDLERVIPKTATAVLRLDRLALKAAVERASLFARDAGHVVDCDVRAGALRLHAGGTDYGQHEEEVDAFTDFGEAEEAPAITVGLHGGQFLDALGAVPGDTIELRVLSPGAPVVFTSDALPSYVHLSMPMAAAR